jgi:hypothetical protein
MTDTASLPSTPPVRTRKVWDITLSVVFLVFGLISVAAGVFIEGTVVAFTDYCPPGCDVDAGLAHLALADGVGGGLAVVAAVVSIGMLVTRRRGWWLALLSWLLAMATAVAGFLVYTSAIQAH